MNYSGKHFLILGLGESGLAMARWVAECGARVTVADTRLAPERLPACRAAVQGMTFVGGDFSADLLNTIDSVAVSPGLAPSRELASILPAAQARGIPVWGEIELFAQAIAHLKNTQGYVPKVVAITGTNGKTTVTRLTGLLCERAGLAVQVAGNISPAALDVLREAIAQESLPQVWVLELSSFQLHTTFSLQADVATVLNITQDHLDWHASMAEYVADKARIFGKETVRVINRNDPAVLRMINPGVPTIRFGLDAPTDVDALGVVVENGVSWLALAQAGEVDEVPKRVRKKEAVCVARGEASIVVNRLMPAQALQIRGLHNVANALAALGLCRAIGCPLAALLHGLRTYRGEPHRVQHVAQIGGVDYVDDSKGTNVGATVAALTGLGGAFDNDAARLLLIAGGEGKGQDFTPLVEPIARYVRVVLLIGKDAPLLRAVLAETGVSLHDCATVTQAVEDAAAVAKVGDTVLLSPACASFDMFKNYAHRAQVFVDAVHEVGLARGEII